MTRRRRAGAFALAAVACSLAAASAAQSYADRYRDSFGELREVVVARATLRTGRPLDPDSIERLLSVRRVPRRFVPPGALRDPVEAIGLRPAIAIPRGSYIQRSQLREGEAAGRRPDVPGDRIPVEVAVSGASSVEQLPPDARVDLVVVVDRGDGTVRSRVVERGLPLLDLRQPASGDDMDTAPDGQWRATLAVPPTRAAGVLEAQANAREVRLLPTAG